MTKTETVFEQLQAGWVSMPDLMALTGWQAHTLRAAISVSARKLNLAIERQRIDGVTHYRVKP